MPKLWSETIGAHRRQVRDAILATTAALIADHGPLSVTMSQIAEAAGISRATLYKYFADVEAVLLAWHERHVTDHLLQLTEIANNAGSAEVRLAAVLQAYAFISYQRPHTNLTELLHRDDHVIHAEQQLTALIRRLLVEAARNGDVREDVAAEELASYCLHALTAAGTLSSKAAVQRLVKLTLAGIQPQRPDPRCGGTWSA